MQHHQLQRWGSHVFVLGRILPWGGGGSGGGGVAFSSGMLCMSVARAHRDTEGPVVPARRQCLLTAARLPLPCWCPPHGHPLVSYFVTERHLWSYRRGEIFAAGLFRRGIFRISNSCEISHAIFRPLCEINPLRNLAKCLVCCALPQELKQRNVAVRICNGGSCDRTFLIAVRKVRLRTLPAACYILCRDGK